VIAVASLSRENINAIAEAVLVKLTPQLDDAADKRFRAYNEKLVRLTDEFVMRAEANLQAAAGWTEDQMVVSTQQKLGALVDRIQASRTIIENQLARFEALQKNSASVVEETEQKIREASQLALRSALQDLAISLRKGVESTSATLEGECQALVLDAVTRTVNATLTKADQQLALQTKERLSKAYAELKQQQEQMIDGLKEQLNQVVVAGKTDLSAKFETLAGEIVPSLRTEMEKSLQESAGNVVAQTTQSLQEHGQLATRDTLASLQQAAKNLEGRILENHEGQLAAHSRLALERFQSGLQALARETQAGATQLFSQKVQGIVDEMAEGAGEQVRRHIQDKAFAATEVFGRESNQRLSAIAEEFYAGSAKEFQERLRKMAEAQLDSAIQSAPDKLNERLNRLTQAAGVTLVKVTGSELQRLAGTLFKSSSETLRKEAEQLSVDLQNDLKAFEATLADQARTQLLSMSRSTVQSLNQEALTGVDKFRARLHAAAQETHEQSLRELEGNLRESLEKLRAAILVMVQQPKD
jgi:hypothetical protein